MWKSDRKEVQETEHNPKKTLKLPLEERIKGRGRRGRSARSFNRDAICPRLSLSADMDQEMMRGTPERGEARREEGQQDAKLNKIRNRSCLKRNFDKRNQMERR